MHPKTASQINEVLATKGYLKLQPATYELDGPIDIPRCGRLEGTGCATELHARHPDPVIRFDGVDNASLKSVRITRQAPGHKTVGVKIRGDTRNILVEDVSVSECMNGFDVEGQPNDPVKQVTFRHCSATHSSPTGKHSQFGFVAADCDELSLINCSADHQGLDGVKLRKSTKHVVISGGSYNLNGTSGLTKSGAGDGIDVYPGGDTFIIRDVTCNCNTGSGITIKTDDATAAKPNVVGYVRNIQVANVVCCHNRALGMGIYVKDTGKGGGRERIPLPAHATVSGGLFCENGRWGSDKGNPCRLDQRILDRNRRNTFPGIYIEARNVSLRGPIVRENGGHGIQLAGRTMFCTMVAPIVIANSQRRRGRYDGIHVMGRCIQVLGGTVLGAEKDRIRNPLDYGDPDADPHHRHNIFVHRDARHVTIRDVCESYSTKTERIRDERPTNLQESYLGDTADTCTGNLAVLDEWGNWVAVKVGVPATVDVMLDASGYWRWKCRRKRKLSRGLSPWRRHVGRLRVLHKPNGDVRWSCYELT